MLHCDSDYVVVNKPPGLPCMRHESNGVEVLAACVGRALGMEELEVGDFGAVWVDAWAGGEACVLVLGEGCGNGGCWKGQATGRRTHVGWPVGR